jgi:hypothetical protein
VVGQAELGVGTLLDRQVRELRGLLQEVGQAGVVVVLRAAVGRDRLLKR